MNDTPSHPRSEAAAPGPTGTLQRLAAAATGWLAALLGGTAQAQAQEPMRYRGLCDASAAVALDAQHFVVANDEDNLLRIYRRGEASPQGTLALAGFLGADKESDLEGAARIGQRIYWIASHGRNASAKLRAERYRFFATEVDSSLTPPRLRPVATAQTTLLAQLIEAPSLQAWRLADAARLAPEARGGLNIEGLADTAQGELLIGFRNPVREGKALLAVLRNPAALLDGAKADIGRAIALDLGGRGVRSIERVGSDYLVVAGPVADQGDFAAYRWSGQPGAAPQRIGGVALGTLRPEAIFAWPDSGTLQLLSDDGGIETAGAACKDRPEAERSFRSIELRLY